MTAVSKDKRIGFLVDFKIARRLRNLAKDADVSMTQVLIRLIKEAPLRRGPRGK